MDWLVSHLPVIVSIAGPVLVIAGILARFTSTSVDDAIVDLLNRLLGIVGSPKQVSVTRRSDDEPLMKERTRE